MTPQELKNSILQLAIQGKLVEQRPEEGVAEVPAALQHGGKEARRHGEIEPPFDIPESWRWVRLEQVADKITDGSHNPPPNTGSGYPVISAKNIKNGRITLENVDRFTDEAGFSKENPRTRITNGDIIIGIIGGSIGNVGVYTHEIPVIAQRSIAIIHSLIDTSYLTFVLKGPLVQDFLRSTTAGSAQGGVYLGTLKSVLIPLPPLAEQKRIVSKIEELLPLLARYEQAWSKLEAFNTRFPSDLQKSLLQLAIQGKLVEQRPEEGNAETLYRQIQSEKHRLVQFGKIKKEKSLPEITEDEIPFDIPESWKWVRVAKIWTVLNGDRGKNYPAKSTLSQKGIPFISALNLDGRTVVADDRLLCLSDKQYDRLGNGKLIKGDIVVCIRGSLGKHARYPFEKGAIASSLVIMRSHLDIPILDEFLMLYLDTPLFFSEIKKYDNGTAQPNLAAKSLEQFLFPLPPLAEQKRIVAKLEELLPLCERLK